MPDSGLETTAPELPDTPFFKVSEFACHDGTPYPREWADQWARLSALCNAVRDEWHGALAVVSGYRTPGFNAGLIKADNAQGVHGVASGSQHVLGLAADLRPEHPANAAMLYRVVRAAYDAGRLPMLGGVGIYATSNWVHVDCRVNPDHHLSKWVGT